MALAKLLQISAVRDFLFDGKVMGEFREVAIKHNLPPERANEFLDLCNAVIDGGLPMADIPSIVAEAFGVDEANAKNISADLLGYRLLPLEAYIPGVKDQIIAWGGKPEDYSDSKISKEKVTGTEWATRLTTKAQIAFSDVLLKRLAFLLEGRVKGEKDTEALRAFFGRSLNIGGLGLVKIQVDTLLAAIEEEVNFVEIISEEEMKKIEAEKNKVVEEPVEEAEEVEVAVAPVVTTALEISPSHALAASVPVISHPEERPSAEAVNKAKSLRNNSADALRESFAKAIDIALEDAEPTLRLKKIPDKVFADLAGKAIRGIRDVYQTRDVLERDYKLTPPEVALLLDAVKKGMDIYHSGGGKGLPEEIPEETAVAIEEAESLVLDKRFAALTNSAPGERIESVLPGARVSAARTKEEEMRNNSSQLSAEDVKKAEVARRPKPVKAELTVGSVAPQKGDSRKVTDIVTASRLIGPIEQLKVLTPVEFRRLSSNPLEAAQKIEDLISSIEASSYEDKMKAVKAFRSSPINQLYLAITEETLSQGISVPEIASKRRAAGKESLSPAEIKALIQLNARLRF